MDEIKIYIYEIVQKGAEKLNLEVSRSGKTIKVSEPLTNLLNANFGPEDLEDLRKKYL